MANKDNGGRLALSLEELVVVLNLLGYPEVAKGLLVSQLGEINPDEERGRLLAANHSLMAKDILYLQGRSIRMEESPARLLGFLITNDFAVRGTVRSKNGIEESLTYYVRNQSVVEHHLTHGIVHTFQESILSTAVDALASFMMPPAGATFQLPSFTLGNEQLNQAQLLIAAEGVEAGHSFLEATGIGEATAAYLAEDLSRQTLRSAAMQVIVDMNKGISADHGYLILGSATGRAWLMDIQEQNGAGELVIQPATEELVKQMTEALFKHH